MARDLITGLFNLGEMKESLKKEVVYLDIDKVYPSLENFYSMKEEDILKMARSIEAVGEIKQPLLVKRTGTDVYEVIAGHKRRAGVMQLVNEGKNEYRNLPCIVEQENIDNELSLILTNATQRELSPFEKMKQVQILKEYLEKNEIEGNKREIISELMNLSKSEIGRLENINKNLSEPLKETFKNGNIATGTANEIASMPRGRQEKVHEIIKKNGTIKMGEVRAIKESVVEEEKEDKPIEGQMEIHDYPECIPDGEVVAESKKIEKQENFISDAEFRKILEEVWREANRNYDLVKNSNEVSCALFMKLRIKKEALDMYRSNYLSEDEVK